MPDFYIANIGSRAPSTLLWGTLWFFSCCLGQRFSPSLSFLLTLYPSSFSISHVHIHNESTAIYTASIILACTTMSNMKKGVKARSPYPGNLTIL